MAAARILVVDDDAWILRMVTTVLEKRGYDVETAVDGDAAYRKAIANPPDLLISDVMMPKMDGWSLIKALRSRPEFAFIPVIFLTALGSDDDRIKGFRLGADDYLPKPFRFEELDLRVAKTLQRKELVERAARERLGLQPPQSSRGKRTTTGPTSGLAGTLNQVGLSALLTLLEMERKSGILVVTCKDTEDRVIGRIFLREGRVHAARIDDQEEPRNSECIYTMLGWVKGRFEFNAMEVDMEDQVESSTTGLLMEGARRIDEAAAGI